MTQKIMTAREIAMAFEGASQQERKRLRFIYGGDEGYWSLQPADKEFSVMEFERPI